MDLELREKLALVTGGNGGIGLRISRVLAEEGCHIALCGRNPSTVESTVAELRARGARAVGIVADVTAPGEAERFVEEAAAALGGVDLLVNNVGGSFGPRTFPESTVEDWEKTFNINLFQSLRCVRTAIPHMRNRGGGSVVTISSISGWRPGAPPQYGAAKAAEIFYSSQLAWELAADKIRVNTISPGSILWDGGGWDRWREANPERFERFRDGDFPWKRFGKPEEVADAVAFILSPRAMWINGANIPVDGAQAWGSVFTK